jgi:Xaa-Pro aminopeptidase
MKRQEGELLRTRRLRYADELKARYPLHKFERAAKIMKELRGIKTALEIEVLQKAIDITDNTFRRTIKIHSTRSDGIRNSRQRSGIHF